MVVCLPTADHAGKYPYCCGMSCCTSNRIQGTLITNFLGPHRLAQEISSLYVERVLESHSLGRQSLGCVWILAFSILKTTAEQIDFAFDVFDPIDPSSNVS